MTHVYGIKSCGSVQKALKFLEAKGIPYTFHDFKITPVEGDKIEKWLQKTTLATLLNTKGTTYRTLGIKALELDDTRKVEWMGKHNLLIKRPVIEFKDQLLIGFDESLYEGLFHT